MSSPTVDPAFHPALAGMDVQRRLKTLKRWRRHSALIGALRRILPVLIAAALLGLIGWAAYNTLVLRLSGASQTQGMAIRMINPKFYGRDGSGKPFFLAAASAVRDNDQFQLIHLDQPVVVMGEIASEQTKVTAKKGLYREDTRILILDGDVHMHNGQGDDFLSPHAVVDTLTNDIDGQAHVDGHGPLGSISASSYSVRNGGAQVFFTGRVAAHIEQQAVAAQNAGAGAPAAGVLRGSR